MNFKEKSKSEKIVVFVALSLALAAIASIIIDAADLLPNASVAFTPLLGALLIALFYLNRKTTRGMSVFYLICGGLMIIVWIIGLFV